MEGIGQPEDSKEHQPWTLEKMIENRDKWNLAADVGVLEYLQKFGNDLLSETENTLQLLDTFEAELNTSCVQVSNITNQFLLLADSQFVENRVYDDEETPAPEKSAAVSNTVTKTKEEEEKEVSDRLKQAIANGLNVLKTKFEVVEVANSDSEEDDNGPTGVVYKPINPFNNPLPHLIGSVEFMKDPTVGLEEPPSDEEEESIDESLSSESKAISEGSEDSEPESDRPNTMQHSNKSHNDDLSDILYKQPISSSFVDHLAKRLEDIDNERKIEPQSQKPTRSFYSSTPPPLDDTCDDEFGSSEDLIFGNRNNRKPFDDDLFVPKSKSSLWDDDSDFPAATDIGIADKIDDVSERRKTAVSDFERELAKNLKKRNVHSSDSYDDILSPSPPPLDEQANNAYDGKFNDDFRKRDSPPESLFGDDYYNDHSKTLFMPNESKQIAASSSEDLFSSLSKAVHSDSTSNPKKKLPAGAVNIFPVNILKDKKDLANSKSELLRDQINKQDLNDSDAITKSISNLRRRNDSDDDSITNNESNDAEDINNSVVQTGNQQSKSSSRSSSVKMSESFQDDNLSNKSGSLFDDVVTNTTKKNAIKKNMDDLFSDLNYQNADDDDDDDLFGNSIKGDNKTKTNKTADLSNALSGAGTSKAVNVMDDLFGDVDNDDLFSKLKVTKVIEPKSTIGKEPTKDVNNKTVATKDDKILTDVSKKQLTSLFDDGDDVDVFMPGSVFSDTKVKKSSVGKSSENKQVTTNPPTLSQSSKKKMVGSLFDDEDDSDLFGGESVKKDLFASDLFQSTSSTVSKNTDKDKVLLTKDNSRKEAPSLFANDKVDNDNLFSSSMGKVDKTICNDIRDNIIKDVKNQNQEKSSSDSKLVLQNEIHNVDQQQRNEIKTANVKQISLFSNENHETSDSLFASPVKNDNTVINKNRNEVPCPVVTDDSPLFNESVNQPKLFDDKTNLMPKVIDTKAPNAESESELRIKNEDLRGNSKDVISNTVENKTSENSDVPMPEDVVSTALLSDNGNLSTTHNLCANIGEEKLNPDSVVGKDKKTSELNDDLLFGDTKLSLKSENVFNVDKSLPSIPGPPTTRKRPEIPVKPKPNKPEPPKSLNIRSPITVPDIFSSNGNKATLPSDVTDGGAFSSAKSSDKSPTSPRTIPGKLNLERTLKIDPRTLLPGARPISFKKSSSPPESNDSLTSPKSNPTNDGSESVNDKHSTDLKPSETSSVPNSEPVLHSIAKDRVKIQVKRRPQTRKARQEAVRRSMIDNADGDETDNSLSVTTSHSGKENSTSSLFDQPSNVLSPSTDEEDLFGVPPLDLPADYTKVSTSPGDIFDTPNPTIISPNLHIIDGKFDNIISKKSTVSEDIESGDKLFDSNVLIKDNKVAADNQVSKNILSDDVDGVSDDLFSSEPKNSVDLFGSAASLDDNNKDLFGATNSNNSDVFSSTKNLVDDKSTLSINNKQEPLFSDVGDEAPELFTNEKRVETNSNVDENQIDDLFTSVRNETDIGAPKQVIGDVETRKNLDKSKLFSDLDDSDLFAGSSVPNKSKFITENEGKLVKQDPSRNVICSAFNSGVVNICDKLSITPPNDDELFPPSDWSVSNSSGREENKTITSVPEKLKTSSLFDDNADDYDLFHKPSKSAAKVSSGGKEPVGDKKKAKEVKDSVKTSVDNLFSNDVDDDASLFGEVKVAKKKDPVVVSSKTIQSNEGARTKVLPLKLKSSLFDADDDNDGSDGIFSPSASSVKGLSNKSLDIIFESSSGVSHQGTSKKPGAGVGAVKKYGVTSSVKIPDNKTTGKDDFVDPLSAFSDD